MLLTKRLWIKGFQLNEYMVFIEFKCISIILKLFLILKFEFQWTSELKLEQFNWFENKQIHFNVNPFNCREATNLIVIKFNLNSIQFRIQIMKRDNQIGDELNESILKFIDSIVSYSISLIINWQTKFRWNWVKWHVNSSELI